MAFEPGEPGFAFTFESSEECLEGAVGAAEDAASNGDVECGPFRQVGAYESELFHLVDAGYGGALHLPGVSSFLELGVVQGTAHGEVLVQQEVSAIAEVSIELERFVSW